MENHEDETSHATYSYIKAIEDGDMKDIKKGHKFPIKKIIRLLVMLLSVVAVGYFAIKGKLDYALCAGLFLLLQFRPVISYIRRFTLDTVKAEAVTWVHFYLTESPAFKRGFPEGGSSELSLRNGSPYCGT